MRIKRWEIWVEYRGENGYHAEKRLERRFLTRSFARLMAETLPIIDPRFTHTVRRQTRGESASS